MGTGHRQPQKILIVPHQPHRGIRVRALEIARYLAQQPARDQVYVLTWELAQAVSGGVFAKTATRLSEMIRFSSAQESITPDPDTPNLFWVRLPYLLAPNGLCQWFNQQQIGRFMAHQQVDTVINANAYHFPIPKTTARYIYDVVDDHLSPESGPHWKATRAFTLSECRKADRIMAISHGLQAVLAQEGIRDVVRVPNGVDMATCAAVSSETALASLKATYAPNGEFLIAYVGNHGWWSGTEFLLRVFEKMREQVPNSRLLIVGPGEDVDRCREKHQGDHVVFTGPVSPQEATDFFHLGDIGVLPFSLCPFTHHALPLKIMEYGAAKKRVVSSPLHELEALNFPHVDLTPLQEHLWAETLIDYAKNPQAWKAEWDKAIAAYNWPVLLQGLSRLLIDEDEKESAP